MTSWQGSRISCRFAGRAAGAEAAPVKVLSKTQLRHALLTVDDLPSGFRIDRSASKKSNDDVTVSSNDPACQSSLNMTDPARTPGQVSETEADFKRERDSAFAFSYEAATVGLAAFRSAAAVRKDFAANAPQLRACHAISMDMGDGTKISFTVKTKVRRTDDRHRTFVMLLHGGYMGIHMNMAMTVSQERNYEVTTMLMGANRSMTYVTKLANTLRRDQIAKLTASMR